MTKGCFDNDENRVDAPSQRAGLKRRDLLITSSLVASAALIGAPMLIAASQPATAQASAAPSNMLPSDEIAEAAVSAYIYAYPLILMEITRRVGTNVADHGRFGSAPMNQFANVPAFPDADFSDVVRPNADTLYSILWFDVSKEPLLINAPNSGGRYYLLPMLDMWTNVFASPGERTTGTGAQLIAIAAPGWQGNLPAGATLLRCPTGIGWIIGRTQTNGKADYDAVRKFQAGLITRRRSANGAASGLPGARSIPNGI